MLLLSEPFSPSPEPACHCVTEAGLLVFLSAVLSPTIAGENLAPGLAHPFILVDFHFSVV